MRTSGVYGRVACAALAWLGLASCGGVTLEKSDTTSSGGAGGGDCGDTSADCDGDGTCETALGSVQDCGGCGDACSSHDGTPSCSAGACTIACDAGYADCNGDASDGCEAALDRDPGNCNACGSLCAPAGDCFQGTCLDILAAAPAAAVGADALVLEGPDLYWSTPGVDLVGAIARVPTSGGATIPLVTGIRAPERLRSNGQWLVWSDFVDDGVYRMQLPVGPVETVHPAVGVHVLDVDDTSVYFTTGTDVEVIPIAGGTPSVLASGFHDVSAGRLHGGALYFADLGPEVVQALAGFAVPGHPEGTIQRVDLGSLEISLVADKLDTPTSITTTNDAIYWAESGSMATREYEGVSMNVGSLGRVARAGLDGSNQVVLASALVQPWEVAVDASHVYVANAGTVGGTDPANIAYFSDGSLVRVPISGGAIETIVPAIDPRRIVLSNDSVFFASYVYGLIMKKSK